MRSEIRISALLIAIPVLLMIMMFAPAAEASSKKAAATTEIKRTCRCRHLCAISRSRPESRIANADTTNAGRPGLRLSRSRRYLSERA